jgi:hypothetical protein
VTRLDHRLFYGFDWCKPKHLTLQFKMKKTFPLVTNGYPLSGKNPISNKEKLCPKFSKNGLRGSTTQLIFILKYRYCIDRFRCERPITRYFMGRAHKCELYKFTITLIE